MGERGADARAGRDAAVMSFTVICDGCGKKLDDVDVYHRVAYWSIRRVAPDQKDSTSAVQHEFCEACAAQRKVRREDQRNKPVLRDARDG